MSENRTVQDVVITWAIAYAASRKAYSLAAARGATHAEAYKCSKSALNWTATLVAWSPIFLCAAVLSGFALSAPDTAAAGVVGLVISLGLTAGLVTGLVRSFNRARYGYSSQEALGRAIPSAPKRIDTDW